MDGAAGADGDDFCAQPPGHQSCTERAYFVGGLREWSERAARNASSPRRPLRRETVQFLAVRLQDLPLMLTTTGCARVFVPLPRAVYSYYGQYTHHACAARASFSAVLRAPMMVGSDRRATGARSGPTPHRFGTR